MNDNVAIILVILSICLLLSVLAVLAWCIFNPSCSNNDSYSDSNSESFTERPRVVVSFTTIPSRLPYLSKLAKQINKQTFQPDAIYACIPKYSARLKEKYDLEKYQIPPEFTIVQTEDYGPATKILGCLDLETDPETIIVTVDDDVEYSSEMLEELVKVAIENPSAKVGSRASRNNHSKKLPKNSSVVEDQHIMLLGFGGIAYRRGMFTEYARKWLQNLPTDNPCWLSDDLTLDKILDADKIKVKNLVKTDRTIVNRVDALRDNKRKSTYKQCYKFMEEALTV